MVCGCNVKEGDNRIIQASSSSSEVQTESLPAGRGGHVQQAPGHVQALQGVRPGPQGARGQGGFSDILIPL